MSQLGPDARPAVHNVPAQERSAAVGQLRISVVVPVFNAVAFLGEQLGALALQTIRDGWEVIVADNGSTDGSRSLAESWRGRLPCLRVVDASARPGAAAARNQGAQAARGRVLAFCDADDVVSADWVQACADAIEEHDFVAGAMDHDTLNVGAPARWHVHSHVHEAPIALRYKPYALSSNLAVSRRAFDAVGGFAEDLRAVGEDVDISWRLQLAGFALHFEPRARIAYRHRHALGAVWKQHLDYGFADPVLYKRFRRFGVRRVPVGNALRAYLLLLVGLSRLLAHDTRGIWVRQAAKRWGRLLGSIRERVVYL